VGRYVVRLDDGDDYQEAILQLSVGDQISLVKDGEGDSGVGVRCLDITGSAVGHLNSWSWPARAMDNDEFRILAQVAEIEEDISKPGIKIISLSIFTESDASTVPEEMPFDDEDVSKPYDHSGQLKVLGCIGLLIALCFILMLSPKEEGSSTAGSSRSAGALNETEAVVICEMQLKQQLVSSDSFETKGMWPAYSISPEMALIDRDYTATNAYGAKIDNTYHCQFNPMTSTVIDIQLER
jgi:hypothetical protein